MAILLALPVVAWAGVLFWLSDQPASAFQGSEAFRASDIDVPGRDYLVHAGLYFVLGGLLWLWARLGMGLSEMLAVPVAVGFAVLYGISDEWHQSFVPGRSPDVWDVVADGAGALLASACLWTVSVYWRKRFSSSAGDGDARG